MVSESKVLQSKYRNEIIDMLRSKWPLHRIRQWLLARGENISIMFLSRLDGKVYKLELICINCGLDV